MTEKAFQDGKEFFSTLEDLLATTIAEKNTGQSIFGPGTEYAGLKITLYGPELFILLAT